MYTQWRDEQPEGFRTVSLSMAGPTDVPIYTAVMVKHDRPFRGRSYALLSRAALGAKINELMLAQPPLYPYILTATGPQSSPLYAACFREMAAMPLAAPNLSAEEYRAETKAQRDLDSILLWVDCFGTGSSVRYCAVWGANEKGEAWNAEAIDDKKPERQERFDALATIGARPVLVAMTHNGGLARMFVDSRLLLSHSSRSNMSPSEMQGEIQTQQASRRYPVRIGTAVVNNEVRYSAIFAESDDLRARTFRLRGPSPIGLSPADKPKAAELDTWMQTYVKAHRLRGAALAVVEGTRLVYTKAYTYAETDYPTLEPTSLFRMASVSKTFVAIAVWRLLADTNWSRNDRMQDILGLKQLDGSAPADPDEFGKITVRHLLESCSGIDQGSVRGAVADRIDDSGNPRRNQPLTLPEIAQMIAAKPLAGTPGVTSEYGSTDYILLSLIAAKIAGTTDFEGALKKAVLDPLHMMRTVGSRSRLETQPAGHVRHHAKGLATGKSAIHDDRRLVPVQYGHENYEVYEGAGGLSSAIVDLARLCAMLSCRSNNPVLSATALTEMLNDGVRATDKYSSHGFHGFDWVKAKPNGQFQLEKGGTNPGVRAGFTGRTGQRIYIVARNGEPWPLATPTDWKTEIAARADTVNWAGGDLFPQFGMPSL